MTDAIAEAHTQRELHVEVFSPRDPNPKHFAWSPDLTVGQAAVEAAASFGYVGGNPTLQNSAGAALDRSVTLDQAGVRNGDRLELVDAGGGV